MLVMRCPTCGELLANKQLVYEEYMKNTCEKLGIDFNALSQGFDRNEKYRKVRQDIIKKLCRRICCKQNIMNYVDKVHLIVG